MLMVLLDDVFSPATKKRIMSINRAYLAQIFLERRDAFSSCRELNDLNRAYSFFNVSLRTDVSNLYGNTYEGIHAAALGGTWQALVFGFAGVQIKKEKLCIDPRMPRTWKKIIFSLMWRSALVKLAVSNETIQIKISASKIKYLEVGIFDKLVSLKTGKTYTFARKTPGYITEYYY
jgi:trehalose/maltose hydrolase-like predicted phosphorylase